LLIVVDEFAALVSELPEFVDGMVDVAQRGRSLGIHLVLATQRPQAVINDKIRANTNLRLALRFNDDGESLYAAGTRDARRTRPPVRGRPWASWTSLVSNGSPSSSSRSMTRGAC